MYFIYIKYTFVKPVIITFNLFLMIKEIYNWLFLQQANIKNYIDFLYPVIQLNTFVCL